MVNSSSKGACGFTAAFAAAAALGLLLLFAMSPTAYADDRGHAGSTGDASGSARDTAFTPAAVSAVSADASADAEQHAESEPSAEIVADCRVIEDGLYNIGSVASSGISLSVDNRSKRSGARVVPADRVDVDWAQKWVVTWDAGSGYYKIRNLNSRKYLGVSGKVKRGAIVKQYKSAKAKSRLWEPVVMQDGVAFKSAGTKYALTLTSKGKFKLRKAKSAEKTPASQKFQLSEVDPLEVDRTYYLRNVKSGKRLNVANGSRRNKAKLNLAARSSDKSQKFRLLKVGSEYRLQNVSSCYYVGTNGKGRGKVRQLDVKRAKTRWNVNFDLEAAAFSLSSAKSGLCLNGKGKKLSLKRPSGKDNQLFTFTKTHAFKLYLDPGHGMNNTGSGSYDPGATGSGCQEADLTADLASRVEAILADSDVKVVNGGKYGLPYYERMANAIRLGCDANVSLHFDADGGSGTLKMVGGDRRRTPGSVELADCVHVGVVANLGLSDRGLSVRDDIMVVNADLPSMLEEVCFIDNSGDVETYLSRRDAVAQGIAEGIVQASRTRAVLR